MSTLGCFLSVLFVEMIHFHCGRTHSAAGKNKLELNGELAPWRMEQVFITLLSPRWMQISAETSLRLRFHYGDQSDRLIGVVVLTHWQTENTQISPLELGPGSRSRWLGHLRASRDAICECKAEWCRDNDRRVTTAVRHRCNEQKEIRDCDCECVEKCIKTGVH